MGYVFEVERSDCFNCGVCMDICPVEALEMSRESGSVEFPVQVAECIGCQLCAAECPTGVVSVRATRRPVALATRPEPIARVPVRGSSWSPWSPWRGVTASLVAPCQEACPIGTDAGRYVALVAEGRYADALAVVSEFNPLPAVCGRVCTAACEVACRRDVLDEPIAIRELKRFVADRAADDRRELSGLVPAREAEGPPPARASAGRPPQRVAIVGAGPTGLAAAHALVRSGHAVTVYEAMPVAGGMLAIGIPEYRLPRRVLRADIERILALGVDLRLNTALGRDVTLEGLKAGGNEAILLATGASKSQRLGLPGEGAEGVWPATLFLKEMNVGERRIQLAGDALVVGGGSTAIDAARSAWRAGARSVRVLYRRTREDMPAQADEVRAAEHEGVAIETLVAPIEVLHKNGWITGLRCTRLAPAGRDEDGRSVVAPISGSEFTVDGTSLFVAVGEASDPSILPEGSSIQVSAWGGVVVDAGSLATAQPGVFAAGDVATGPRSVIEGIAQGQRAAWAIDRYLRGLPPAPYLPPWRAGRPDRVALPVGVDLANRGRAVVPLRRVGADGADRTAEVALGLGELAAGGEARRCLRCDVLAGCPAPALSAGRSA